MEARLETIWQAYFADVKKANQVSIRFSGPSKFRFGSIRLYKKNWLGKSASKILINGNFTKSSIPAGVVDYTIAHELVHYAHGFSSSLPRLHRYPHQGGVVNRELEKRGMTKAVGCYKRWLKEYRKLVIGRSRA